MLSCSVHALLNRRAPPKADDVPPPSMQHCTTTARLATCAHGWWLVEIDGAVRFLDIVVVATEFMGSMQALTPALAGGR